MRFTSILLAFCLISTMSRAQVSAQIGSTTYEYWPNAASKENARPSFALLKAPDARPVTTQPTVTPRFGFSDDFRFTAEIDIEDGTDLYGTGENAGPLRRNGTVVECWNTDQPSYTEKDPSLYQSHPWVLAVRKDGTAFGVLADTTYRCRIDLRKSILFAADGPEYPVIVIEGKSPQEVVMKLADLTGHMQLPPMWALGYHQCRWSYMSADEALQIAQEFRKRHVPCDTIWFDIDYMDGFRIFTFNPTTFPDPAALNNKLSSMGFHNVWMIDPGVKIDSHYPVYSSGVKADVFVKDRSGRDVRGDVWPGTCAFPDFTRPETRAWWADLYKPWLANGIDGVWNDMNEPSFFNVPTKTMPEEALHRGGEEIAPGPHAEYHNVYGMQMARATHDGLMKTNPEKRPFLLTRAGYIGYQRYAATWTGDNVSSWHDLQNAIPMVLNLGLSGQPFAGPDIPGFGENGPADQNENWDLFTRWYGLGSLMPFSRGHAAKGTIRKEPWSLGIEAEESTRKALWRRYVLLPYLYTAFFEASKTGMPVARPLFFADPKNVDLRSRDDAFLLGGDISVQAITTPDIGQPVVIDGPPNWTPFRMSAEGRSIPTLQMRPGAIVPMGPPQEYVGQHPLDNLFLVINLDDNGVASGELYEDAGDGYGYQRGDYLLTKFQATTKGTMVDLVATTEGSRKDIKRFVKVFVLRDGALMSTGVMPYTHRLEIPVPLKGPKIGKHEAPIVGPAYEG